MFSLNPAHEVFQDGRKVRDSSKRRTGDHDAGCMLEEEESKEEDHT